MALLLVASGALIFGLLKLWNRKPPEFHPFSTNSQSLEIPRPAIESAEPSGTNPSPAPPALPTSPAEQAPVIEPAAVNPPDGAEAKLPAMDAREVLVKFLAAKSLDERLPMMETKTPESELAASCLSGPLPPAKPVGIDRQESNRIEGFVDYYFSVDFEGNDNTPHAHTLAVRIRGQMTPKVLADPFLDLFGGRLAAYASKPSDKPGTFQVIVSALASCNDPQIPDRDKKLTLKLLARNNTKEIAQAYFNRMSKIHEMIESGNYLLTYSKAKACTVTIRWNTEDYPDHPYLEAIQLKALDWNP